VVAERDQLAYAVAFLNAAGGVGEDDRVEAERADHAHGEDDLLWRVAFVKMHTALHDDDGNFVQEACDNAARVSLDVDWGNAELGVGNGDRLGDRVGTAPSPEPRTNPMRGRSEPSLLRRNAAASET